MTLSSRTFSDVVSFTRGTGATRISPTSGFIVGVDFSTTSNTIGTGSKTFTLTADANVNREWTVGENVLVTSQAGATGTMTGTVTSYTPSTQALVINVPTGGTTGSGTSTDWRIGSLEVRRDANGVLVEEQSTNTFTASDRLDGFATTTSSTRAENSGISPNGSNNAVLLTVVGDGSGPFLIRSGGSNNVSCFFKRVNTDWVALSNSSAFAFFNIGSGEIGTVQSGTASLTNVGNGWYRAVWNPTIGSGVLRVRIAGFNNNTGGVAAGLSALVFGVQSSNNPINSYIPTTTTSWTRAADSLSLTSAAVNSIRQGESTVVVTTQNTDNSTAQKRALRLTGPTGEIRVGKQGVGTNASFTKMVEGNNTLLLGSSTAGNLFKNTGLAYEPALGARNDTGATNTNLAIGLASNAVASSGNGFGVAGGQYELTTDSTLSSVTVRGVGGDTLTDAHWTGGRFIFTNSSLRPVISLDGTSYRVVNSPTITQPCTALTSGLVGVVTRVVMVGANGAIFTSDDQGETWTARTSGTTQDLYATTFGNNRFVAVGNTNVAVTSSDGITWSAVTGLTGRLNDIIHTGSQFVAINSVGGVFTSTDGITFTAATVSGINPAFTSAQGIAYDNGFYTIVGNSGQIVIAQATANATSFTFSTFVAAQTGTSAPLNKVLAFGGRFYVGGNVALIEYTQSLTPTFTSRSIGSLNYTGFASSGTRLLVTANASLIYSNDGISFTNITNSNQTLNGIAFGNNRFVSVGNAANGSGYIATIDPDGTVTRRVSNTTNNILDIVYYGGTTYYAITNSQVLVSSDSGTTWSVAFTQGTFALNCLAVNGQQIVISGQANFTVFSSNGGSTFTTRNQSFGGISFNCLSAAFGNGVYVFVGAGGNIVTATTASVTTSTGGTLRTSGTTQALTSVMYSTRDNCWYAAGANGTLLVSYDNAVTWRPVQDAGITGITDTTLQANATAQVFVSGTNRIALSYKANRVITSINGHTTISDTSASIPSITGGVIGDTFNGYITSIRFDSTAYDASDVSRLSNGVEPDLAINDLAANALGDQLATDAAQNTLNA